MSLVVSSERAFRRCADSVGKRTANALSIVGSAGSSGGRAETSEPTEKTGTTSWSPGQSRAKQVVSLDDSGDQSSPGENQSGRSAGSGALSMADRTALQTLETTDTSGGISRWESLARVGGNLRKVGRTDHPALGVADNRLAARRQKPPQSRRCREATCDKHHLFVAFFSSTEKDPETDQPIITCHCTITKTTKASQSLPVTGKSTTGCSLNLMRMCGTGSGHSPNCGSDFGKLSARSDAR